MSRKSDGDEDAVIVNVEAIAERLDAQVAEMRKFVADVRAQRAAERQRQQEGGAAKA